MTSNHPQQQKTASGRFMLNLSFFVALGVAVLYWIGYHTELLAVVGGLLGLGGAFAWIAFVSNLVKEDRKKELQEWFDSLLSKAWTTAACVILAIIMVGVGGTFGSVRIDARRDMTDRFVEVRDPRNKDEEAIYRAGVLTARSARTFPVYVGWSNRAYEVRVDGLPALTVETTFYHRRTVVSPDEFLSRNILLLRPTTELSQTAQKAETENKLTVKIGRAGRFETFRLDDYRGETVWIGCDETVAIPATLKERWRLELIAGGPPIPEASILPWLTPRAIANRRLIALGERIDIMLGHPGEAPWMEMAAVVEECGRPDCFPQEVVLRPNQSPTGNNDE